MTGAGDAQCQPMTRSGRSVAAASATIGSPDVFDARIVAAGDSRSRSRNTLIFRSSRSGTASITRSVAAASSNVVGERDARQRRVGLLARELAALDRAVEPEAARRSRARGPSRARRRRRRSRPSRGPRSRSPARSRCPSRPRRARRCAPGQSSMRASQSPGASSSARVGTMCSPSQSRFSPSSPARSMTPRQNATPSS